MAPESPIPSKLQLSASGLQQIDERLSQLGWGKQSKQWASAANVGVATIRRFRARMRITADAFQAICRALDLDWQAVADWPIAPDSISGSVPDSVLGATPESSSRPSVTPNFQDKAAALAQSNGEVWVQREGVFQQLVEQLQSGCRVLAITGMTGIGKTVLSTQLTHHFQPPLNQVIDLNFEARSQTRFIDTATDCLEREGQRVTEEEKQDPQQLMRRWLALLVREPRWVVMDSLEQILKGNEQNGWSVFEDPLWEEFFHQLLGWETCQSQFILTSQDSPTQIEIHGLRYKRQFHLEPLQGLPAAAQAELFRGYGFAPTDSGSDSNTDSTDWTYLTQIGAAYEGHPLALQVIIGEILDCYGGNVSAYWQRYGREIAVSGTRDPDQVPNQDLHRAERPQLDRYSRQLRLTVRYRLEDAFTRLRQDLPDAYLLLCMAATYREAVTEDFLLGTLRRRGYPEQRCQVALDTLLERNLLELNPSQKLRQHSLIRSVALDHFQRLDPSS